MSSSLQLLLILLASFVASSFIHAQEFVFSEHLKLDGASEIMPNGSAMPIDVTGLRNGQVFYAQPFKFKSSETGINPLSSFSTTFVFSINLESPTETNHQEGFSFVISSSKWLSIDRENRLDDSSLIMINFKISRDWMGFENNHLEISINGATVVKHSPLGYYRHRQSSDEVIRKVMVTKGQFIQVWLDYDGLKKEISGSVSPVSSSGPKTHSFSYPLDITPFVSENMFVGISLSSSRNNIKHLSSNYYILAWSMKMNGEAQQLDIEKIFEFTRNDQVLDNFISQRIEGFDSPFPSDFRCLSCLEKYLRMMNCTTEQIEVLEGQCMASLLGRNVNHRENLVEGRLQIR